MRCVWLRRNLAAPLSHGHPRARSRAPQYCRGGMEPERGVRNLTHGGGPVAAGVLERRTVAKPSRLFDAPVGCRREGMMAITTRVRSVAGVGAGFAAVVIAGGLTWVMWPTLSDAEDKPASIQSAVQPSEETPAASD